MGKKWRRFCTKESHREGGSQCGQKPNLRLVVGGGCGGGLCWAKKGLCGGKIGGKGAEPGQENGREKNACVQGKKREEWDKRNGGCNFSLFTFLDGDSKIRDSRESLKQNSQRLMRT